MRKTLFTTIFPVLCTILLSTAALAQTGSKATLSVTDPIRIEKASVLPGGQVAIEAGLAFELGREFAELEYDNLRLAPLGVRYGLGQGVEVGAFLGISANDQDDLGAPDNSGLEGLSVFGKVALNEYAAILAGLTALGDDDVAPYPNDGLDIFANLALQRPLGPGKLLGEFGYTAQGGDLDFSSYFNYGVGYAFPLNQQVGLSFELVGEEGQFGTAFSNTLQLVGGANILLSSNVVLAPYLGIGLRDASPDLALGAMFQFRP